MHFSAPVDESMNELHQKLAVLSSSLNSSSPQQLADLQSNVLPGMAYNPQQGKGDYASQAAVDSPASYAYNQPPQQQQQHQQNTMQTVIGTPILANSSSASPMVVSVPMNNNNTNNSNIIGHSPAMPCSTGTPVQGIFNPQMIQTNSGISTTPSNDQVLMSSQSALSVAHPNVLVNAMQSPLSINPPPSSAMSNFSNNNPPHHHPINDLASNSMIYTTPTTTIITTNKLIGAITSQGGSGPVGSVSVQTNQTTKDHFKRVLGFSLIFPNHTNW